MDAASELQTQGNRDLVVSTVHRAKGLEFDNVVLVDPLTWTRDHDDPDLDQEVRTTYVAITRSRDRLVTATGPFSRHVWLDRRSGRWIRGGSKRWMTFGFELKGADSRSATPVGDPVEGTQAYIADHVRGGASVDLELDPRHSTLDHPVYSVIHDGRPISRTSSLFGDALVRRIGLGSKRSGKPWPGLRGAVVESIETAAGPLPNGSGWQLWLSPRLGGLVSLEW
jgi:DNA helicase-2/ATP-dependent DNA helicase PcrA